MCDGSHRSEGWQCAAPEDVVLPFGFVASESLGSLAERLAHRFRGAVLMPGGDPFSCERLVVLTDGQGLARLHLLREAVRSSETVVVCVGVDPQVIAWAFSGSLCIGVAAQAGPRLWAEVEGAIEGAKPAALRVRPKLFLSHAVQDERRLLPVVEVLREHFGLELFFCADSIPSGTQWSQEIERELRKCDVFVLVASEASSSSAFCSFEAGMAVALKKRIGVVALDGAAIPAFLQDLQAQDTRRIQGLRPWLNEEEALLEAFLSILEPRPEGPEESRS